MPRTRAAAKKDADTWKAVAKDMKKKGANYRKPGDMPPPPPRRAPKPPEKPKAKSKAPEKPANKRTGQDYRDWADLRDRIKKDKEGRKNRRKTLPYKI